MTTFPPKSASGTEDVRLPDGPVVRIRTAGSDDREAIESLLASDEATRMGTRGKEEASAIFGHRSDAVEGAETAHAGVPAGAREPAEPVVIVGGGVAALECLIALRDLVDPGVRIPLVSPEDAFVYRPLQVAEPFSLGRAWRFPLAWIAADFGAELITDTVTEVHADEHRVICGSGSALDYGSLVLTPGARRERAFENCITFGLDPHHRSLHGLLVDVEQGRVKDLAFVVPPDTSWSLPAYELALMTAREIRARAIDDAHLTLVTPEPRPLAVFGPQTSETVAGLLEAAGIEFVRGVQANIRKGSIRVQPSGRTIEIDEAIALPVLRGLLFTGDDDRFLRTAVGGEGDGTSAGSALWWPPSKVAGLYLAPYLAAHNGLRERIVGER